MILGLDISTRMTGATVVDRSGAMIFNESWDTRNKNKFPDHFEKAAFIKERLLKIEKENNIVAIFIEKPFMFFNSGGSTAKTMSALQSFNGMVSWITRDVFGLTPQYLTAGESRKLVGIKVKRGENSKKKVVDFVVDNEPDFVLDYTKAGNLRPGISDRADSWVLAKAGMVLWKSKKES